MVKLFTTEKYFGRELNDFLDARSVVFLPFPYTDIQYRSTGAGRRPEQGSARRARPLAGAPSDATDQSKLRNSVV